MADGGVPHDRRAPVVAGQHDRTVVERRRHGGHVAGQLGQRVALDLRRRRAPAVAAHVHGRRPVPALGQVAHLVVPRRRQLGPAVHAQHHGPVAGDLDPQRDVAVVDQQLVHATERSTARARAPEGGVDETRAMTLEVGVLGPLEARRDGQPSSRSVARQQRRLLAALVAAPRARWCRSTGSSRRCGPTTRPTAPAGPS